jgi:predicted transcriptional regulator
MSSKFVKPQTRFLLGLVRQLLQDRPGLTGADVARELNLSESGGRYYMARAREDDEPPELDALALAYMQQNPLAAVRHLQEHLGVGRSTAQRLRAAARAKILEDAARASLQTTRASTARTYNIPKFKDLK